MIAKVLFRHPTTLRLVAIPYDLREGQAPGDLLRAYNNWRAPLPGHYGPRRIDLSNWVTLSDAQESKIPRDMIPMQPWEYVAIVGGLEIPD